MTKNDIEKAFLDAAEIAKKLPKNLQEAGFNRALEQLIGKQPSSNAGGRRTGAAHRPRGHKENIDENERGNILDLINEVDRTSYPDVGSTRRVADRALKVLLLMYQGHGVDGLTASEIATILSRKFRLPTKANSVSKALERETETVDVRSGAGPSRVFHIMAAGETYLRKLQSEEEVGRTGKLGKKTGVKKATKRSIAAAKNTTSDATIKKTGSRPGPKAVLGHLIESGFFHSARTVSEILEELKHKRGHTYSVQELSPALVRSIRDQSLIRERNDKGHYEYSQA